jgi:predicted metal-binding membrane protein
MSGQTQVASAVERLVRRDRLIAGVALLAIALLAWLSLVRMAVRMSMASDDSMNMPGMMMTPGMQSWSAGDAWTLFLMWAVMMVAMMLPSAGPTILLVLGAHRRRGGGDSALASACFAGGYLAVWTAFSGIAALAQWGLHRAAILSPEMTAAVPLFSGTLLIAAGIYQWLPLKYACLSHCRSPLAFLARHWRTGLGGSFRMGLLHGAFCLGCCWALMALLFVGGVMNLLWVGILTAFVLVEKLAPHGLLVGRAAGVILAAWGLWVILR